MTSLAGVHFRLESSPCPGNAREWMGEIDGWSVAFGELRSGRLDLIPIARGHHPKIFRSQRIVMAGSPKR